MNYCSKFLNLATLNASLALILVGTLNASASSQRPLSQILNVDLDTWIQTQQTQSRNLMLADVSRPGTAKGSVVAAPAIGGSPNYYFHWVRDSGLVMDVVVSLLEKSDSPRDSAKYSQILSDFIYFSSHIQNSVNRSGNPWDTGPGEPKFNVDGSNCNDDWGRPQNDGPAIRSSTLIRLANLLIDQGQLNWVQTYLYNAAIPSTVLLKADLEFVAHHWRDSSYDLWEEVRGAHFYTQMVQRRALVEGAELANRLGDGGAAAFYQSQAQEIEIEILRHWDPSRGYIVETLDPVAGLSTKSSGLDVAAVLAVLHGTVQHVPAQPDSFFSATDDRVLATALKLKQVFQNLYPVNQRKARLAAGLAPGIGRYPEDRYNGYTTSSLGNPWFLATNAFAELYYKAASQYEQAGAIEIKPIVYAWLKDFADGTSLSIQQGETIQKSDSRFSSLMTSIRQEGDQFLRTTQTHLDGDGNMSEEFNRNSGSMEGAENLTWSHASFLTAIWARGN